MKTTSNKLPITRSATLALVAALGSIGVAWADTADTVHLGTSEVTKEQVIQLLSPEGTPALKTRGLRVHNDEEKPAATETQAEAPRSLSLEVYFAFDSAHLSQEAIEQLAPVGEALQSQELSGLTFTLEGHTDASGAEDYNLSLSERRAMSVKSFFTERYALSEDRVRAEGKGEAELIDGASPTSGVNRRVTIIAQ